MQKIPKRIHDLPLLERPREKLLDKGPAALSDLELMAVILGKGSRGRSVFELAKDVLSVLDEAPGLAHHAQLAVIPGMGKANTSSLSAAMEFARRRIRPVGYKIRQPSDALSLIRHFADRKQEHFLTISLNGANEVIAHRLITVGLVNRSQVHPREVFADAITDRASGIIVAHNHPSGDLTPSRADFEVTQRLKSAGEMLGIQLLDHLIFSTQGHYSFSEMGRL